MDLSSIFANAPVETPPKGVQSDFDAPAPYAVTLKTLNILTLSLAWAMVLIRLYVKRFVSKQKILWDDGLCVAAATVAVIHFGIILKNLEYGLGKRMYNIRATSLTHQRILAFTSGNLVILVNMLLVRISILALYHRLFGVCETSKLLVRIGFFLTVLVAVPELGVAIARMIQCQSLVANLTVQICRKKAISTVVMTHAIAGCFVDIFIYSIAISRLRHLRVKRNKKIQVIVIFALGLLAVMCSFTNFVFNAVYFKTSDQMWYAFWISIFKTLEANIALICACATFLPALWKSFDIRSRSPISVPSKTSGLKDAIFKERSSDDALVNFQSSDLTLPNTIHSKIERSGRPLYI